MKKINYRSDFDFIFILHDSRGVEIGWPGFDWSERICCGSKLDALEARVAALKRKHENKNGRPQPPALS